MNINAYRMDSTVHSIGSKESKDAHINIYKNVQYSTLNRVERVER